MGLNCNNLFSEPDVVGFDVDGSRGKSQSTDLWIRKRERERERERDRERMIAATVGCWNVHNPCLVIKDGRTPACRVTSLPQTTTELTMERFGIFLWSLEWDPLVSSDKAIAICYYARNVANVKYTPIYTIQKQTKSCIHRTDKTVNHVLRTGHSFQLPTCALITVRNLLSSVLSF